MTEDTSEKVVKKSNKTKLNWRKRNPSRARNLQYKYYYNNYIKSIPNTEQGLKECRQVAQWFTSRHQHDLENN